MNKFYWESVGECVNQVYAIEADNWEAAKKIAFADMKAGDILAECPPSAVIEGPYDGYHFIDKEQCEEYVRLCRGSWDGDSWLENVYYWDDDIETLYDSNYKVLDSSEDFDE